ncbi:unnamed protein product, partial [Mycena citricolor]
IAAPAAASAGADDRAPRDAVCALQPAPAAAAAATTTATACPGVPTRAPADRLAARHAAAPRAPARVRGRRGDGRARAHGDGDGDVEAAGRRDGELEPGPRAAGEDRRAQETRVDAAAAHGAHPLCARVVRAEDEDDGGDHGAEEPTRERTPAAHRIAQQDHGRPQPSGHAALLADARDRRAAHEARRADDRGERVRAHEGGRRPAARRARAVAAPGARGDAARARDGRRRAGRC